MKVYAIARYAILTVLMLAIASILMRTGINYFYSGFSSLDFGTRSVIVALLVAIPYYLSAFFAFFVSPYCLDLSREKPILIIAGRNFHLNTDFFNPANHLAISSVLVLASLSTLFFL